MLDDNLGLGLGLEEIEQQETANIRFLMSEHGDCKVGERARQSFIRIWQQLPQQMPRIDCQHQSKLRERMLPSQDQNINPRDGGLNFLQECMVGQSVGGRGQAE